MAAREKYPSQAGRKALLNIAAGMDSARGLYGHAVLGGHSATMTALRSRGWVTEGEQLTAAGQAMVERLIGKPLESRHGA